MKKLFASVLMALTAGAAVHAADLPVASDLDPRVRYVTFKKDDVTVVSTRRGAVTRLILADDEKIEVAATGFPADCSNPQSEWCVRADIGTNQIWVKPKDNATANNLELKTNKRDYSFEFKVLKDSPTGRAGKLTAEPMFRVIFRYPIELPPLASVLALSGTPAPVNEKAVVDELVKTAKPVPRNWKYSMQVLKGSDEIAPTLVFDDGRFTYFQFPANREVPSIYYISPSEEEGRVNFHMEGDLAVVERTGRRFVLRLGEATVGVWNDAYDPFGVAPKDGVTVDGLKREIR
ncbi:conjugal transfer protein [Variovorax guangxiensis]|uniref:Conjugal transfer protein n=1 Tax=Variovorax guangxiensis TaxID=1775474 RepID=A0A3S0XF22_9BURK|nr:TrbG/VirB9 family P-type conjugative transfer protein [Variovorax guangxiensis]RUR71889.1 conjugal transfer protein [Variovorax guangxiensis]